MPQHTYTFLYHHHIFLTMTLCGQNMSLTEWWISEWLMKLHWRLYFVCVCFCIKWFYWCNRMLKYNIPVILYIVWIFFLSLSLFFEAIGTAATPGLLCQPRVIVKMIMEKQMECRWAGETEVLGENLPQRHFCPSQNLTWPDPGLNPGRRGVSNVKYGCLYGLNFDMSQRPWNIYCY
jgi:hypothetical protein